LEYKHHGGRAVRDSNANGVSDSKPDGYGDGDTYRHGNANSHSYRNADGDGSADSYANTDTVSGSNSPL
jgi:hypothetical protein